MNENVLGFIKWAAGIVITLAIISIAFIVFNMAKDGTMAGVKKIEAMNTQISESDLTIYDDSEVSGSEVVNVVKKYQETYLAISVKTGKNPGGAWYGYSATLSSDSASMGAKSSEDLSDAIDETKNKYINPNGRFKGKIFRDENNAIIAIVFEQK